MVIISQLFDQVGAHNLNGNISSKTFDNPRHRTLLLVHVVRFSPLHTYMNGHNCQDCYSSWAPAEIFLEGEGQNHQHLKNRLKFRRAEGSINKIFCVFCDVLD